MYRYSQKCIAIPYFLKLNCGLLVYSISLHSLVYRLLFKANFYFSLLDISLRHPLAFFKLKVAVACWSNLQHEQLCTSFTNEAMVFEMPK